MLFKLLRFVLSTLFILCTLFVFSKEKSIKIVFNLIEKNEIKSAKIYGFYGHEQFLIDSTILTFPKTTFILENESLYKGFYRVYFSKELFYDFISFPGDSISINLNKNDFKNGLISTNEDNKLLLQFKKEIHELNNTILLIQNIQSTDTFIQNSTLSSIIELKIRKNELITEYQQKFHAKVFYILTDFLREPLDEYGNESGKIFLQNLHLEDSSSIRTNFISQKLIDYLAFYKNPDEESFNEGIKEVFSACGTNEFTRQYCLFYYLQLFYEVGPEPVFRHLVEEYYQKESCHDLTGNMNVELFSGINKLMQLLPGNKIENFNLIDSRGRHIATSKESKKHKQTLYLFWSPDCPHCEELIVEMKKYYSKIKKNKIEIIAIAITDDKKNWLEKSKSFKWINTSDLKGWQSEIVKNLAVNKTPLLILTDSSNMILKYDFNFDEFMKENH